MYCFVVFLKLCSADEMDYAFIRLQPASYYLCVVLALMIARDPPGTYHLLCTATGWIAAAAPLLTFMFSVSSSPSLSWHLFCSPLVCSDYHHVHTQAELTADMLPHWAPSLICLVHCVAWGVREINMHDYLAMVFLCFY
jgi:hypothetical protein